METLKIEIQLIEPMLGTVPKNKEIYSKYVADKTNEKNQTEELETIQELEEKGWTGFHINPVTKDLFIYDYMIKGFLKEAAGALKSELGLKNHKSKIDNLVFVFPREISLNKKEPDGVVERPLRVMTPQGPRVCLARSDYVEAGIRFDVEIKLVNPKEVSKKMIFTILDYGQLKGLGQFRNGSYGRFTYTLQD